MFQNQVRKPCANILLKRLLGTPSNAPVQTGASFSHLHVYLQDVTNDSWLPFWVHFDSPNGQNISQSAHQQKHHKTIQLVMPRDSQMDPKMTSKSVCFLQLRMFFELFCMKGSAWNACTLDSIQLPTGQLDLNYANLKYLK